MWVLNGVKYTAECRLFLEYTCILNPIPKYYPAIVHSKVTVEVYVVYIYKHVGMVDKG